MTPEEILALAKKEAEDKAKKEEEDKKKAPLDLTANVNLNKNPYLIPPNANTAGWVYFRPFLIKKLNALINNFPYEKYNVPRDTPKNKLIEVVNRAKAFDITKEILDEFNKDYDIVVDDNYYIWVKTDKLNKYSRVGEGYYNYEKRLVKRKAVVTFRFQDRFPNGIVTKADIEDIQRYHNMTSFQGANQVLIDGIIGTQTMQLYYPFPSNPNPATVSDSLDTYGRPLGRLTKDGIVSSRLLYPDGWLAILWGDQRFVVSARNYDNAIAETEEGRIPRPVVEKLGDSGGGRALAIQNLIPYIPAKHDPFLQGKNMQLFPFSTPLGKAWEDAGREPVVFKDQTQANKDIEARKKEILELKVNTIVTRTLIEKEEFKKQLLKERKAIIAKSQEFEDKFGSQAVGASDKGYTPPKL